MGGEGSGRKPDPVKMLIGKDYNSSVTSADLQLPNYSGVKTHIQQHGGLTETDPVFTAWLNGGAIQDDSNKDAINIDDRELFDKEEYKALNWDTRELFDSSEDTAVNWEDRLLSDGTTTSIDWYGRYLWDSLNYSAAAWDARILLAADGSTTQLDWSDESEPTLSDGTYPNDGSDCVESITIVGGRITAVTGVVFPA
jgi:hypothetical protein